MLSVDSQTIIFSSVRDVYNSSSHTTAITLPGPYPVLAQWWMGTYYYNIHVLPILRIPTRFDFVTGRNAAAGE